MAALSVAPGYSPSLPAPSYSCQPACDEQTLDHTPRSASRPRPTGTYTKTSKRVTLVLNEQDDNAELPSYGRHSIVDGTIHLEDRETISEVVLKLEGRLDLVISEGGSTSVKTIQDSYTLWTKENARGSCPSAIPFSCIFPSTFKDGDRDRPLPPSYDVGFPRVPGLFVKSYYTLTAMIFKSHRRRIAFWTKCKSLSVRLQYSPRTRPHRPVLPNHYLFSTVKSSPEEWQQVLSKMATRPNSNVEPIHCHLFAPSVQIFALSDTIPFHVQLTGPVSSLRHFLPPPTLEPITSSTGSHSSTKSNKKRNCIPPKPIIRVYLLRQITVEIRGQKVWRDCKLGEGKIWPLPPLPPSATSSHSDSQEESLDWEGEVRCRENITVGGFNAGKAAVKDFLVLALSPPDPQNSPLLELQCAHPIRLVTDAWVDITMPETWT